MTSGKKCNLLEQMQANERNYQSDVTMTQQVLRLCSSAISSVVISTTLDRVSRFPLSTHLLFIYKV